jgi:hypothetical protein
LVTNQPDISLLTFELEKGDDYYDKNDNDDKEQKQTPSIISSTVETAVKVKIFKVKSRILTTGTYLMCNKTFT